MIYPDGMAEIGGLEAGLLTLHIFEHVIADRNKTFRGQEHLKIVHKTELLVYSRNDRSGAAAGIVLHGAIACTTSQSAIELPLVIGFRLHVKGLVELVAPGYHDRLLIV